MVDLTRGSRRPVAPKGHYRCIRWLGRTVVALTVTGMAILLVQQQQAVFQNLQFMTQLDTEQLQSVLRVDSTPRTSSSSMTRRINLVSPKVVRNEEGPKRVSSLDVSDLPTLEFKLREQRLRSARLNPNYGARLQYIKARKRPVKPPFIHFGDPNATRPLVVNQTHPDCLVVYHIPKTVCEE